MIIDPLILTVDTRDPWPHPWAKWLPSHVKMERGTLETGDICLKGLDQGAVIERKGSTSDLLCCLGKERERFEKELRRSRFLGALCVVVEASLNDCLNDPRSALHPSSILGSLAAWTRRYGVSFAFCDNEKNAAEFAFRFLQSQITEARKLLSSLESSESSESSENKPKSGSLSLGRTSRVQTIEQKGLNE